MKVTTILIALVGATSAVQAGGVGRMVKGIFSRDPEFARALLGLPPPQLITNDYQLTQYFRGTRQDHCRMANGCRKPIKHFPGDDVCP